MSRFLAHAWGAFISRLYWRFGRPYDADAFWHRVACYHIRDAKVDGKYVIAEMTRISAHRLRGEQKSYAKSYAKTDA